MIRKLFLIVALIMVLSGCGDRSYHGKDISHLMPPLEFELIDERGESVSERIFAGHPVAVYFGFSHCPDICPMTLAKLTAAARRLPGETDDALQLAFVSVDPERDDPQRLAAYTAAFSENLRGLTGSQRQLQALTRRYRVTYGYEEPDDEGNYEVSHSSAVWVFNAGLGAELMLFDDLSIEQMTEDLAQLLSESRGNF